MKLHLAPRRDGSALIVALIVTAIIGINLVSYLALVRQQNRLNMRSLTWNSAIALAEAGAEEAIAHMNRNYAGGLTSEGWSFTNGNYTMTRTLGDGYYTVQIQSNLNPVITSYGYVQIPASILAAGPGPVFAAAGVSVSGYANRGVRVVITNSPLFVKSLVAKYDIDLKGNNMYSDSFDSSTNTYSTGGLYDATKRRDNGDIASNSSLTNSIHGGNATVYGSVATGPGGSVLIGSSGAVGTIAWIGAGNYGIQSGRYKDDMNVSFSSVDAPYSTATAPPGPVNLSGTNWGAGTNYTYVVGDGDWLLTSISLAGNQTILVNGKARLYVTGDFSMSGQSTLVIAPGASLKTYFGGNATLTGQGIYNMAGNALNCQFYGLDTCTQFKLSGQPSFTGVLYAPNAEYTATGNGIYYGAVVCKTAKFSGNSSYHYDEALAVFGPGRGYIPIDWKEL
ncbi:MAG TPA: hypothetical protein VI454_16615 [Verrucomicrobiae bacterium]|jgi:hypothetical protein